MKVLKKTIVAALSITAFAVFFWLLMLPEGNYWKFVFAVLGGLASISTIFLMVYDSKKILFFLYGLISMLTPFVFLGVYSRIGLLLVFALGCLILSSILVMKEPHEKVKRIFLSSWPYYLALGSLFAAIVINKVPDHLSDNWK